MEDMGAPAKMVAVSDDAAAGGQIGNTSLVSPPLPSQPRLLVLMDHSLDLVEFVGSDGLIQGVSGAIKSLGGYDPEHLVGSHYQQILHPDDCGTAADAFARILRGETVEPITLRYRHNDGSWRIIQATARNFLADPSVHAIIVLTRDKTDQVNAEVSLAHANDELRRLSQQLIKAQEKERNRLALELHDDVQQILVGLRMSMESSPQPPANPILENGVNAWITLLRKAIDHLHALTLTLRTPVIGKGGLQAELRTHVNRLQLAPNQKIQLDLDPDLGRLPADLELACFRIVQEALANAINHSRAKDLRVSVNTTPHDLCVIISDDGVGFDVPAARARALTAGSIGLLSMRERAALAGGRLEVISSAGHGTCVRARFRNYLYTV